MEQPSASRMDLPRARRSTAKRVLVRGHTGSSLSLNMEHPGQTAHPESEETDQQDPPRNPSLGIPGWDEQIHPNGVLYYHNGPRRLTTNIDLRSAKAAERLQDHLKRIDQVVQLHGSWYIPTDWEVLIEEEGFTWIDHAHEAASTQSQEPLEFQRSLHIVFDLRRTSRYWAFIQAYPCHPEIDAARYAEAVESLTWCYADRLLFGQSNATFSKGDSKELLDILFSLQEVECPTKTWFIACILLAMYTDRHNTQWGRQEAFETRQREREETTALIETHTWPSAFLFYVVGFVIFLGVPYSYFSRIQSVDRTRFKDGISTDRWRAFLSSILQEWRETNLVATVLLTANVSFLAVPELGNSSRILSLISTVASMGSACIGFFLSWKHQAKRLSSAEMGLRYFIRAKLTFQSSVPLALILSLPVVLLLWAFLSFMAAVGTYAIADDSGGRFTSGTSLSTAITLAILVLCAVISWFFFTKAWSPLSQKHLDALTRYLDSGLQRTQRTTEVLLHSVPNTMRRYPRRADTHTFEQGHLIGSEAQPSSAQVPADQVLPRTEPRHSRDRFPGFDFRGSPYSWSSTQSVTHSVPNSPPSSRVHSPLHGSRRPMERTVVGQNAPGIESVRHEIQDGSRMRSPTRRATRSLPSSPVVRLSAALYDTAEIGGGLVRSPTLPRSLVEEQSSAPGGQGDTDSSSSHSNLQLPPPYLAAQASSTLSVVDEGSETRSVRSDRVITAVEDEQTPSS